MQKIKKELGKHPFISLHLIICFILILFHLVYGFENIYFLSINPSSWYSLFLGLFFVLIVYLAVDSKTSKKLEEINSIEKNICQETQNIKQNNKQTKFNVDKIFFQIERTSALNKYPNNKKFEALNESYQPTILSLFDDKEFEISVIIDSNKSYLYYKVKPVRNNENSIPRTKTVLSNKFYIVEVISPSYLRGTTQLEDYKYSPIKEGEYYGCQFIENPCSWVMGQPLSPIEDNQRFYEFYLAGSDHSAEIIPSANEAMGYNHNYPGNEHSVIDQFIIGMDGTFPAQSGSLFQLLQKDTQIFFKIQDSPLKKVYILETGFHSQRKEFLVFENLRGHIKNEKFVENLRNKILEK